MQSSQTVSPRQHSLFDLKCSSGIEPHQHLCTSDYNLLSSIELPSAQRRRYVSVTYLIIFKLLVLVTLTRAILANWDLDALRGKALAERGTLNNTRESLGRVNGEDVTEAGGKDRSRCLVGTEPRG